MKVAGNAYARITADVRITDFEIYDVSSDAISYYEEFSKSNLYSNVSLPTENSNIIYKIEVTNFGSRNAGIYSINLGNNNLSYELVDYDLQTKICDSNNFCGSGTKMEFYMIIYYNNYDSNTTTFDLDISFDFQPFYTIEYVNFNEEYINEVLGNMTLKLDFTDESLDRLIVYLDDALMTDYELSSSILTIPCVSGDIIIENKTVYKEELLDTAVPVLDSNMVPVEWDVSLDSWIVADLYEDGYSYEDTRWANVVVFNESVSYEAGTVIDAYDSNISQWYVWIPQFLLDIDNVSFTSDYSGEIPDADSISIVFGNIDG